MRPQILVVDDDPLTRELLTSCLDSEGYDTVCAEDGVVAKERLEAEAERFDVVLLDRLMPRMDGIALLQWDQGNPRPAGTFRSSCKRPHRAKGKSSKASVPGRSII